jgi:hypothetical protein
MTMNNLPNIEKSAFHRGEYVGYGGGYVWRIRKSTSSYGNWFAFVSGPAPVQHNSPQLMAWRLTDMSEKLSALGA